MRKSKKYWKSIVKNGIFAVELQQKENTVGTRMAPLSESTVV